MDITGAVQYFFAHKGFKRLEYEQRIVWIREADNEMAMVEIIPEWLPGQPRTGIDDLETEGARIERDIMVRTGKRVDRLTVMISPGLPDKEEIERTMNYPDIWWIDSKGLDVIVYEKQRIDFQGLRSGLEDFLILWGKENRARKVMEWQQLFQPVTLALICINIVSFIVMSLLGDTEDAVFMSTHGALTWDSVVVSGEYYRIFTSMFLHFGFNHLLQNLLILLLTGSRLERSLGQVRFLTVYLGSGLVASLTSLFFTLKDTGDVAAGASGAIFGVMGSMLFLLLKDKITGVKKYLRGMGLAGIAFMILCAASYGFFSTGVDNAAHIGGLVGGFVLSFLLTLRDA